MLNEIVRWTFGYSLTPSPLPPPTSQFELSALNGLSFSIQEKCENWRVRRYVIKRNRHFIIVALPHLIQFVAENDVEKSFRITHTHRDKPIILHFRVEWKLVRTQHSLETR